MGCLESRQEISSKFNEVAHAYDQQRRKLIPCFDDFYDTAVSLADVSASSPHILDLGAGTGLFSSMLLRRYPKAKFTLIDLSPKMLEIAKSRFHESADVTYLVEDYTNFAAPGKFDLIISALSIHHLSDTGKRTIYRNAYANLKPGGILINADQVLGATPFIESLYTNNWKSKVEASGLARDELDSAYERTRLDRMSALETQINWLKEIGFSDADCVYKNFNFVVMFGRKRSGG
ncbi:methyltransferase domain-containing protein [Paenibacillus sp. N10]|uniref:Methyltransferase domain-containing protein n=1 Tax=Paenibacillus lutrae TaxID=2078573 RepID=A0A7X3FH73_9BACL|nr:methyltransferase domain-containing protein [Paenibacillus lutrae]